MNMKSEGESVSNDDQTTATNEVPGGIDDYEIVYSRLGRETAALTTKDKKAKKQTLKVKTNSTKESEVMNTKREGEVVSNDEQTTAENELLGGSDDAENVLPTNMPIGQNRLTTLPTRRLIPLNAQVLPTNRPTGLYRSKSMYLPPRLILNNRLRNDPMSKTSRQMPTWQKQETAKTEQDIEFKPRLKYTIKKVSRIVATVERERESDIHDICLLHDGTLLMSDCKNNKLKLVDNKYEIIDFCRLNDKPYRLCTINERTFAVTLQMRKIQFVYIKANRSLQNMSGGRIVLGKQIKFDFCCIGAVYSHGELYLTDGRGKIHVYDITGAPRRTYVISSAITPAFHDEWLALSNDGSKLVLTSWILGLIHIERRSGKILSWKIKDRNEEYKGLTIDSNDDALVFKGRQNEIVQIGSNAELIDYVNKIDECYTPRSLCLDEVRKRLLVGLYGNIMVIYNLDIRPRKTYAF